MSYQGLTNSVKYCRAIQEVEDNDILMGVTGPKGSGKTSFSIGHAKMYAARYLGEKEYFSLKKYVAFSNKQVFEKIYSLPNYSPIVGDEGINFAWSREWNKMDNKELTKLATVMRPKHHILYVNIPKLAWIDKAYREGMLDIWIWIHAVVEDGKKQSFAIMFEPDINQGEHDSWHLKKLVKARGVIERIGRYTDRDKLLKLVRKHPCFVDMFAFPQLPKDLYEEYKELRETNVMQNESEYINQKDLAKMMCYNLKNNWESFNKQIQEGRFKNPTHKMIADTLMIDPSTNKQVIQYSTIVKWVTELSMKVPRQTALQENTKEVENDKEAAIEIEEKN